MAGLPTAFPDLHFTIEDQLTDRWGRCLPPVVRSRVDGLIIDHREDGMVTERWEPWDQSGMLQQLG